MILCAPLAQAPKEPSRLPDPRRILPCRATGRSARSRPAHSGGLIHEVLQTYLDEIKTGPARVNYEINSWRDLEKWFAAQAELEKNYQMTRGYPFGTLGNEVTDKDELLRQDLSLIFEVIKNKLPAFFVREKAKGRLAKQADAERMADFCIASMQGAMLMGKIKRSSQTVETTVQEALAHLKSYLVKASALTTALTSPGHNRQGDEVLNSPSRSLSRHCRARRE